MIGRISLLGSLLVAIFILVGQHGANAKAPNQALAKVNYVTPSPLRLNMTTTTNIRLELVFAKDLIPKRWTDNITVTFKSITLSPQFSILQLDRSNSRISVSRRQLEGSKFTHSASLRLEPTYIGHAVVFPDTIEYSSAVSGNEVIKLLDETSMQLPITVVKSSEGDIWSIIFVVSVSFLVLISYINIGAQLDLENLREIIKKPHVLVCGFLITVLVMPAASWLIGLWLLKDQLHYRVGSFIYACCPAASASTLWTVMFNSHKELSIGLQALSTVGSLVTMPVLLLLMDEALQIEGSNQSIQVPYARLIQTLFVLVVALLIGWYFIGRNERAQKISAKIFKPLTFFILFYIIIFSSIVYWYIYILFDWRITLTSLLITLATYCLSGPLGFLASSNLDQTIAISISSTYKNPGIAFAVLLVAFESPDTYINYVPCLTQVLATSIVLYLVYSVFSLVNFIRRRNQPDPIQATTPSETDEARVERILRSGSGASNKEEEKTDEFIAMNVTDVVAGSPEAQPQSGEQQKMDSGC